MSHLLSPYHIQGGQKGMPSLQPISSKKVLLSLRVLTVFLHFFDETDGRT